MSMLETIKNIEDPGIIFSIVVTMSYDLGQYGHGIPWDEFNECYNRMKEFLINNK